MKQITSTNYQKDSLYSVVARAVAELLKKSPVITPVDLLLQLQRITKAQLEDWRFARIPYLERVTIGGLGKMSRLLRILDHHARAIGLKPSQTVYHKWGKGGKRIVLRFSICVNSPPNCLRMTQTIWPRKPSDWSQSCHPPRRRSPPNHGGESHSLQRAGGREAPDIPTIDDE